jgi:hypothetical protein
MRTLSRLAALQPHTGQIFLQAASVPVCEPLSTVWRPSWACSAHPYVASAQPETLQESEEAAPRPVPHAAAQPSRQPFVPLNFDDPQAAFRSKTTSELLLAYGVFTTCQVCG